MRQPVLTVAAFAFMFAGSTACATKGFVQKQITQVDDKVESLSQSVEATQERTRQNETRIGQNEAQIGKVDQKADEVGLWAKSAEETAGTAKSAADAAGAKAAAVDQASKRLFYEVVLSEDESNFKFGKADLPDAAKSRIDDIISQLKADPKGAFVEIEGHTDTVGTKQINDRLGLERAEAVKRYLYEKYQVPLHKMNAISYGEDKPVAPNNTREGRAKNRRVVIRVLT